MIGKTRRELTYETINQTLKIENMFDAKRMWYRIWLQNEIHYDLSLFVGLGLMLLLPVIIFIPGRNPIALIFVFASLFVFFMGTYKDSIGTDQQVDKIIIQIMDLVLKKYPFSKDEIDIYESVYVIELLENNSQVIKLFGIIISRLVRYQDQELISALDEIINNKSMFQFVRSQAQMSKDMLYQLPHPPQQDLMRDKIQIKKKSILDYESDQASVEFMIEQRRCCKLSGRVGDSYCSICGRAVNPDWIVP